MVTHNPAWSASFERERQRLTPVLAPRLVHPIEHMGSTSVPGLVAKPIIDMVAVVESIDELGAIEPLLHEIGWVAAPEPGDAELRKLSYCSPSVEARSHHLHVVEQRSSGWREWLAFRDHLRAHPEVAAEYGELKTRLAEAHGADPNDRTAYRAGKADWVRAVTALALTSLPDANRR